MDSLILRLNASGARYLLIGGQAVRLLGLPRFSMDWDFFLPADDRGNLARIGAALEDELDMPLEPLGPRGEHVIQTYQTRWGVVQFHLAVPGLPSFEDAEGRSIVVYTEDKEPVRCLSPADLLDSKRASGRPQDVQDILFLEELIRVSGGT